MSKILSPSVREIFPGLLVTGVILILVTFALLQRGWQQGADQIHSFEEYAFSLRDKLTAQYFERVGDGQTLSNLGLIRESLAKPNSISKEALDSFLGKFLGIYVVYSRVALLDPQGKVLFAKENGVPSFSKTTFFPGFEQIREPIFQFLEQAKRESIPFVSDNKIYTSPTKDRLERVFFTPVFEKNRLLGFVSLHTNSIILDREIDNLKESLKDKNFPELDISLKNPEGRIIQYRLATAGSNGGSAVEKILFPLIPQGDFQKFSLPMVDPRMNFLPHWTIDIKVNRFELLRWSYWLQLIAILVTLLMGAAIWYVVWIFLRQKDRDQRVFTQGILDAQERERARLAREIHDGVGQILLATKIQLAHLDKTGTVVGEKVTEVNKSLDLAIKEIRTISHGLHPSVLEHLSLTDAVYQKISEIEDVFKEVLLDVNLESIEGSMSKDFKSNLFRILQEGIQNVVKHAKASILSVVLQNEKDRIRLRIEDNGVGFAKNSATKSSLGMRSMEERVKIFGGEFRYGNNERAGGYIECIFDLNERSKQNVGN